MRITWKELTLPLEGIDIDSLLSEWRWLFDATYQPMLMSAFGDLFLRHADGRIFWLSTTWGELTEIAANEPQFDEMRGLPEQADEWFMPSVIGDLITHGITLSVGECYGYKHPPILGGDFAMENFEPTDLAVHFSILGQIHQQIKDLPPGAPIGKIVLKEFDTES